MTEVGVGVDWKDGHLHKKKCLLPAESLLQPGMTPKMTTSAFPMRGQMGNLMWWWW